MWFSKLKGLFVFLSMINFWFYCIVMTEPCLNHFYVTRTYWSFLCNLIDVNIHKWSVYSGNKVVFPIIMVQSLVCWGHSPLSPSHILDSKGLSWSPAWVCFCPYLLLHRCFKDVQWETSENSEKQVRNSEKQGCFSMFSAAFIATVISALWIAPFSVI